MKIGVRGGGLNGRYRETHGVPIGFNSRPAHFLTQTDVLVQCLAHGTVAAKELAYIAFYLFAQSCFVEVETEHIAAAVELTQAAIVLFWLAYLQRGYYLLQLLKHGVG